MAITSEAQRSAKALVRQATTRARAEADELLRTAQRQLAVVVNEAREAEARVAAAREHEVEALERMVSVEAISAGQVIDARDPWVVDLTGEPLDEMVAGAVHAAVRRAVHPVVIRAGRYTIVKTPQPQ
jgi:DNA-binding protein YbaB